MAMAGSRAPVARAQRCGRTTAVHCQAVPACLNLRQTVATSILAASLLLGSAAPRVQAAGLESYELLPSSIDTPQVFRDMKAKTEKNLSAVEDNFEQSPTLKALLAKSEANKAKNKKAIADKYCYRQAELGIGDCGGLRLIPGFTESGKQKTPEWLAKMLGMEVPPEPTGLPVTTLKQMFKDMQEKP